MGKHGKQRERRRQFTIRPTEIDIEKLDQLVTTENAHRTARNGPHAQTITPHAMVHICCRVGLAQLTAYNQQTAAAIAIATDAAQREVQRAGEPPAVPSLPDAAPS